MKILALSAAILAAAGPCLAQNKKGVEAANAKSLSLVGKPAPDFSLPDFQQQSFQLASKRGSVVVLAFWATWCPPCRPEMPVLARMQKEASQGAAIVPVAFDEPQKASDYLAKKKIDLWSLSDTDGAAASLYGAHALPKTFVVNADGIVTKAFIGKVSEAELRSAVEAARR